ncbi:MAG: hypothetical protein WC429_05970, partial [Verrucomicrobiia bacterium]
PALPGRQAGRSAFNPSLAAVSVAVAGSLRRAAGCSPRATIRSLRQITLAPRGMGCAPCRTG